MGGGQRRTLFCPCGFVSKGSPRDVNMRFKMHQKKCDQTDTNPTSLPFDGLTNGRNGMTHTRNGNLTHNEMETDVVMTVLGQKFIYQIPLEKALAHLTKE